MPLTNKQEMIVRDFYSEVLPDDTVFLGAVTANRNAASNLCLELLGYTIYNGKHIRVNSLPKLHYGQVVEVEDCWEEDTKACMEALANETDSDTGPDEADNSESPKGTKVRKALFSKDV